MEFKVGDKVRILDGTKKKDWTFRMKKTLGMVGEIIDIDTYNPKYRVMFEDDSWCYNAEDLEKKNDMEDLRKLIEPSQLLILEGGRKAKTIAIQSGIAVQYYDGNEYSGWDELRVVIGKIEKVYGLSKWGGESCEISEESRLLIWEKKSPTQIKLEELEAEQRKIADKIAELRKEL